MAKSADMIHRLSGGSVDLVHRTDYRLTDCHRTVGLLAGSMYETSSVCEFNVQIRYYRSSVKEPVQCANWLRRRNLFNKTDLKTGHLQSAFIKIEF